MGFVCLGYNNRILFGSLDIVVENAARISFVWFPEKSDCGSHLSIFLQYSFWFYPNLSLAIGL
jgi:hypothetical protein